MLYIILTYTSCAVIVLGSPRMGQVFTSHILKLRTSEDGFFTPKHEVSDILQQQDLVLYDEVLPFMLRRSSVATRNVV